MAVALSVAAVAVLVAVVLVLVAVAVMSLLLLLLLLPSLPPVLVQVLVPLLPPSPARIIPQKHGFMLARIGTEGNRPLVPLLPPSVSFPRTFISFCVVISSSAPGTILCTVVRVLLSADISPHPPSSDTFNSCLHTCWTFCGDLALWRILIRYDWPFFLSHTSHPPFSLPHISARCSLVCSFFCERSRFPVLLLTFLVLSNRWFCRPASNLRMRGRREQLPDGLGRMATGRMATGP